MGEDESRSWRWADADGVQSIVDEWELRSSLSTGTLPAYTLVWQPGWAEWLPACRVAELATVLPKDQVESSVVPKVDTSMKQPPAPPIDKYTAYQTRAAAAKLLGRLGPAPRGTPAPPPGGKVIVPPPQPTPQIRSRTKTKQQVTTPAPPKRVSSTPLMPPTPQPRPAQPTLVENASAPATATLRPPGAVPPPPRGVPAPHDEPPDTPIPPVGMPAIKVTVPHAPAVAVPKEPTIVVMESSPISSEAPTSPQASPEPLKPPRGMLRSEPLPSWSDDLDAEYRAIGRPGGGGNEPNDPTIKIAAQPYRRALPSITLGAGVVRGFRDRAPTVVAGVIALGAVVLLAVIGIVAIAIKAGSGTSTGPSASVSARTPKSKPPPPGTVRPCRLSKAATRLGAKISPVVTPVTAPAPAGSRIAVGFAESEKTASGITVDPSTVEWTQSFSTDTETPVTGVVPLVEKGTLEFGVDSEGGTLRAARTLDLVPPAQLGWTDAGFTKLVKGQQVVTIWPGTTEDKATETRIARLRGKDGFGVTFRRGGQGGEVFVGLLDEKGDRKSDLGSLKSSAEVGTPAIAANEYGTLVAFAARPSADSYWTIQLATAGLGELPKSAAPFRLPPGGPGADAISPAPDGLPNGGWLLQWTEGASGKRQVRVQTLAADLVPVGDPTTLSPEEANAGQGVVIVRNGKALSLFLVKKGKTHELWGASLTCP